MDWGAGVAAHHTDLTQAPPKSPGAPQGSSQGRTRGSKTHRKWHMDECLSYKLQGNAVYMHGNHGTSPPVTNSHSLFRHAGHLGDQREEDKCASSPAAQKTRLHPGDPDGWQGSGASYTAQAPGPGALLGQMGRNARPCPGNTYSARAGAQSTLASVPAHTCTQTQPHTHALMTKTRKHTLVQTCTHARTPRALSACWLAGSLSLPWGTLRAIGRHISKTPSGPPGVVLH